MTTKVNWKQVAQSPGYKSLKAAYEQDVQNGQTGRSKKTLWAHFQWIIGRALHYAERTGRPVEAILDEWESNRNSWWFGFYQEYHLPKLPSGKPRNVRPIGPMTYIKTYSRAHSPKDRFRRLQQERARQARDDRASRGKKARWSAERKARQARLRNL